MISSLVGLLKGLVIQDPADRSKQLILNVSSSATTGTSTTLIASQTANRTIVLPDSDGPFSTASNVETLTNKTIDAGSNTITNLANANLSASAAIAFSKLAPLTSAHILVGNGSNVAADVAVSGDISLSNAGATSYSGIVPLSKGGTGLNSASTNALLNSLLPNQAGHNGDVLTSNGTNTSWTAGGGGGGANTSLSNLATTSLNADLTFNTGTTATIKTQDEAVNVSTQVIVLESGDTTGTGLSGDVLVNTGATVDGNSGTLNLFTGSAGNGNSGNVVMQSGGSSTASGFVSVQSGPSAGIFPSGYIQLLTGNSDAGQSGELDLATGVSTSGNSGSVQISTGTAAGTRGKIRLQDGSEGTAGDVWTSSDTQGSGQWLSIPVSPSMGTSTVLGARGNNTSGTSTTQFDMSADVVVLRNSSNEIVIQTSTGTVTNNTSTAGPTANGRDQAGAFSNSSWVHFYWIWDGATLSTLSSASAPQTPPTLPGGYTHWSYMGAIYKDSGGDLAIVTQRGSWLYNDISSYFATSQTSTSPTNVSLSAVIPPNALSYSLNYAGSITSTGGGLAEAQLAFYSSGFNSFVTLEGSLTGLGAAQAQTLHSGNIIIPNYSDNLRYAWSVASGSSPSAAFKLLGYKIPNGGE